MIFTPAPSCGWEIDEMDYEYEDGDEMELVLDERGKDCLIFRNDMPPAGCQSVWRTVPLLQNVLQDV